MPNSSGFVSTGMASHAAPAATYVPNFCAAAIAALAALWHVVKLPQSPFSMLSLCMAIFFTGAAASAAIGATLEEFCDDAKRGPAWEAMVIGKDIISFGAWCTGLTLIGLASGCKRILSWLGALSGLGFLVVSILGVFAEPEPERLESSFSFAILGGAALLIGAAALACRRRVFRVGCSLIVLGVVVTAIGYFIDTTWLGPVCTPQLPNATATSPFAAPCPLPPGLTPEGLFHCALVSAYLLIAFGSSRIHTVAKTRMLTETATAATLLLSSPYVLDQTVPENRARDGLSLPLNAR